MAYCRMASDSDVYVYMNCGGSYECRTCSFWTKETQEIIDHLRMHQASGDKVPPEAFAKLQGELEPRSLEGAGGGS